MKQSMASNKSSDKGLADEKVKPRNAKKMPPIL